MINSASTPSLTPSRPPTETDAPLGSKSISASPRSSAHRRPHPRRSSPTRCPYPQVSRSIPVRPTARPPCSEAQAHVGPFASTEESQCPEYSRSRHRIARKLRPSRSLPRLCLHRRTQARRPVSTLRHRERLCHPRQAGRRCERRPGRPVG